MESEKTVKMKEEVIPEFQKILNIFDIQLEKSYRLSQSILIKSTSFRDYRSKEDEKDQPCDEHDLVSKLYNKIEDIKRINEILSDAELNFEKLI